MHYTHRNHNRLAPLVYATLELEGIRTGSRNGPVIRMPGVTTLVVTHPRERVNFCPARDANPFFHLVEAMAMLAPMNSVELLSYMAKNMASYSDDGLKYNAFYGTRLRVTWGDQLSDVINELSEKPDSRQAVCQIWDPADLHKQTKDKACNLELVFSIDELGRLAMCSFNRSNDAVWGILSGANVVHLSFFQEYVACGLGLEMGNWTHVSVNLHVYTENPQWAKVKNAPLMCPYHDPEDVTKVSLLGPRLYPRAQDRFQFDVQVRRYLQGCLDAVRSGPYLEELMEMAANTETLPFIRDVAIPVFATWHLRKQGAQAKAVYDLVDQILAPDWQVACRNWIDRRTGGVL